MRETLEQDGAESETIVLRDYLIEFCHNCRHCTQQPGEKPADSVIEDAMHALAEKIEQADCFILVSPTNAGSATAIYKRFMGRLMYGTHKQHKKKATTIGTDMMGFLFTGLSDTKPHPQLSEKVRIKAKKLVVKLL